MHLLNLFSILVNYLEIEHRESSVWLETSSCTRSKLSQGAKLKSRSPCGYVCRRGNWILFDSAKLSIIIITARTRKWSVFVKETKGLNFFSLQIFMITSFSKKIVSLLFSKYFCTRADRQI